jgi:predicted negative regulator of RcsB-dependent stress response
MVSRNFLYVAIGVLVIVGVALGYQSYQERQKTSGLHIDLGDGGISVQSK